jgi:hypothetical protein
MFSLFYSWHPALINIGKAKMIRQLNSKYEISHLIKYSKQTFLKELWMKWKLSAVCYLSFQAPTA